MPDPNIIPLKRKTLVRLLENSVGSRLFNSLFVRLSNTGEVKDVLNDGEFSCAFYVTSLLALLQLFDRTHTTVKTVREKLSEHTGWREVAGALPEPGDVVFWERVLFPDGTENDHVGFVLNEAEAVSTSYLEKQVVRHHLTFGVDPAGNPIRKIVAQYRSREFEQEKQGSTLSQG